MGPRDQSCFLLWIVNFLWLSSGDPRFRDGGLRPSEKSNFHTGWRCSEPMGKSRLWVVAPEHLIITQAANPRSLICVTTYVQWTSKAMYLIIIIRSGALVAWAHRSPRWYFIQSPRSQQISGVNRLEGIKFCGAGSPGNKRSLLIRSSGQSSACMYLILMVSFCPETRAGELIFA
jgi:hypothetical protein